MMMMMASRRRGGEKEKQTNKKALPLFFPPGVVVGGVMWMTPRAHRKGWPEYHGDEEARRWHRRQRHRGGNRATGGP